MIIDQAADTIEPDQVTATTVLLVAPSEYEPAIVSIFEPDYCVFYRAQRYDVAFFLTHRTVDVLLLDVTRASEDDLTLLDNLRANPEWDKISVILLTPDTQTPHVTECLKRGANDVLALPLDAEQAKVKIQRWVDVKRRLEGHEQTIRQLEHAYQTQTRLVQIAAHDLRHPITNLRIAGSLLQGHTVYQADSQPVLEAILLAAETMHAMFEDFTNAFAATQGSLDVVPIVVAQVFNDSLLQYQYTALNKGITLEVTEQAGVLLADYVRLEQALGNLISNAIKYSPQGTTIQLRSQVQDDWVILAVQDQGPGIPQEERHLLFTEFGKLSTQPTGDETSMGLGLWIVDQIVRGMNGYVGVDFPDEGGSVFWMALPAG